MKEDKVEGVLEVDLFTGRKVLRAIGHSVINPIFAPSYAEEQD